MSVFWLLFYKSVAVAVFAAIYEKWNARKLKQSSNLILDLATGRYAQDNRLQVFEDRLKFAALCVAPFLFLYTLFAVYTLLRP
jgi:hypothetical protein